MNCRPAFLLAFVVACVTVVGLDRYLTTDAIALAQDANLYNIRELAQIRATQDAQVCAGYGLRVAEAVSEELKKVSGENTKLLEFSQRMLKENVELTKCVLQAGEIAGENIELKRKARAEQRYRNQMADALQASGIELPEPEREPEPELAVPAAEDRST